MEQEKKLVQLLNSSEFKEINEEFGCLKLDKNGKRGKHDPNWFSLFSSPKNLRELCKKLEMERDYDIFYSSASEIAHATTQKGMMSHVGGEIVFQQIRNVSGFDQIVRYSASLVILTYQMILERYHPEEAADSFRRRDRNEWHKPFMSIPKVVVEGETVSKI